MPEETQMPTKMAQVQAPGKPKPYIAGHQANSSCEVPGGCPGVEPYIAGGPAAYEKYQRRKAWYAANPGGEPFPEDIVEEETVASHTIDDMIAMIIGIILIVAVGYAAIHANENRAPDRPEI